MISLRESFIEAERLGKLRTKNQEKGWKDFCDKKRLNEMQKDKLNKH